MALTDDGTLDTPNTPQNDALNALQNSFPNLVPEMGEMAQTEIATIYSLNTLYFATNGSEWIDQTGWTGGTSPCPGNNTWFGVFCSPDTNQVAVLNLEANDLLGTIPSEIRGLSNLGMLYSKNRKKLLFIVAHAFVWKSSLETMQPVSFFHKTTFWEQYQLLLGKYRHWSILISAAIF
jgi:hypothetical protein